MPENYPYSVNSSLSIGSINIKEGWREVCLPAEQSGICEMPRVNHEVKAP